MPFFNSQFIFLALFFHLFFLLDINSLPNNMLKTHHTVIKNCNSKTIFSKKKKKKNVKFHRYIKHESDWKQIRDKSIEQTLQLHPLTASSSDRLQSTQPEQVFYFLLQSTWSILKKPVTNITNEQQYQVWLPCKKIKGKRFKEKPALTFWARKLVFIPFWKKHWPNL